MLCDIQAICNYICWQFANRIRAVAVRHLTNDGETKRLANNKAPIPWLTTCVYYNLVVGLQRIIITSSLFPEPCEDPVLTDLTKIKEYYDSNGQLHKKDIQNLRSAIVICLNADASFKGVIKEVFSLNTSCQSMLPAFLLLVMCNFQEVFKNTDEKLRYPFLNGYYFGNSKMPPAGQTYRMMPVLGHFDNEGNEPAQDDLTPISSLHDVTLLDLKKCMINNNTTPVVSPISPTMLSVGCWKPYNPNLPEDIKNRNDTHKGLLNKWNQKITIDVDSYASSKSSNITPKKASATEEVEPKTVTPKQKKTPSPKTGKSTQKSSTKKKDAELIALAELQNATSEDKNDTTDNSPQNALATVIADRVHNNKSPPQHEQQGKQ